MTTPTFSTMLRITGLLVLPFSGLFVFASLVGLITKANELGTLELTVGFLLLLISVYLLFGAPHLVKAIDRRR